MSQADIEYNKLLQELVDNSSNVSAERTGTGATNLFGRQLRFNLAEEFPLLTTKKVHMHSIIVELLWFLKGDTNIKYLLEHGVHIWTDWRLKDFNKMRVELGKREVSAQEFEECVRSDKDFANDWGDIGKGYGHQWRNFGGTTIETDHYDGESKAYLMQNIEGFDQISWAINEIKTNPNSRRLIVSGWNPHEVDQVDLPPCHTLFQFYVQDGKLSCQLYQRSADYFLGVPFNIASYALLTHLIAQECGLGVGEFVWTGSVVHLYANHIEQAKLQLIRDTTFSAPNLTLNTQGKSIFDLEPSDIEVTDYLHHPAIKAPVAV